MAKHLEDEFEHLDDLVDRLLGAMGRKLTAAERERLVEATLSTDIDAMVPLITAVEYLASNTAVFDAELHGPLLRCNEGVTLHRRSWLHVACARGDVSTVTALVESCGLDPTRAEPDLNGQTPLHVAAARSHLEVVASLLKWSAGDLAKRDSSGRTPLECAEHHGHAQVAGLIKWWDPSPSWSLDKGHEEEKTIAPQADDLQAESDDARNDHTKAEKKKTGLLMLTDGFAHHEDLVARLFDAIGERSALESGRSRRMLTARERVALVDEARAIEPLAPLVAAVEHVASAPGTDLGDDICRQLLQTNKECILRNRSWFHVMCARGDLDAVTALVERYGLDPTQCEPDCNKETPLHSAASRGFIAIVAFLIKCGLDETRKDWLGRTPRDCAEEHPEVEDLFEALSVPSFTVAKQVAKQVAQEMKEMEADLNTQVEDPKLPKGTAIKDGHDEDTSSTRYINNFIGRGTFGNVYETYHPHGRRKEAAKVVRFVDRQGKPLNDAERVERLRSQVDEAEIMLELGLHPNLVAIRGIRLLRSMQDSSGEAVDFNLYVFMDYVERGMTLAGCLETFAMDIETKVGLSRDIAQGLEHIRRCFPNLECTHWDVKPENILVECARNEEDGAVTPKTAKISDFGKAMTTAYASHETFTYGFDSELAARTQHEWSWATTFMVMLLGKRSWDDYNQAVFKLKDALEFVPYLGDNDGNLFLACLRLCERCMSDVPESRCSMTNVVAELSRMLGDVDAAPLQLVERDQRELWKLHTNIGGILFREVTKTSKDYARAAAHLATATKLAAAIDGEESNLLAASLNNLASLFESQGMYNQAKPFYKRASAITEKTLGAEHPHLATSLNNLAGVLRFQGNYDEAKLLYERAIAIKEKTLGGEHPDLATSLNNLAGVLKAQGKYDAAKPLYERDIAIIEKTLGAEHSALATSLNNLAELLRLQGKYDEAKPFYERAIAIGEKTLGAEHPTLAAKISNFAGLLRAQGKYDEAKPLYERAIAINEKSLGAEHPALATSLNNLAGLLEAQGNYDEAKPLYERDIAITKKTLGIEHPDFATSLNNLAELLRSQGKYEEAKPLYERAIAITEKALGAEHPALATPLNNLALLLRVQGNYHEAKLLNERAIAILEKTLGAEHPDLATSLNNLAELLRAQGKDVEAKPLYERAIAITEKALGAEHPALATRLNNLASLLAQQGSYGEAMALLKRAHAIFQASRGPDHKKTKTVASRLQQVKTLAAENASWPVPPTRHDILQPATRVIVQHVLPELNVHVGLVGSFDDATGRYAVMLEGQDGRTIALEPQNVIQMIEDVRHVDSSAFRGTIVGSRLNKDNSMQEVRVQGAGEGNEVWIPVNRLRLPPGTLVGLDFWRHHTSNWSSLAFWTSWARRLRCLDCSRRDSDDSRATIASRGTIVSWDSTAGCYVVQLSASEQVQLKPDDVVIAC